MPIYEYECLACRNVFEKLRPFDSDPDKCPECGGEIYRLPSVIADIAPMGFSSRRKEPPLVRGESGQLGRRVSETDTRHLSAGIGTDSRGRPKMTPTRPRPR